MLNTYVNNNTTLDKNKFQMLQEVRSDMMDSLDQISDFDMHSYSATDAVAKQTWAELKKKQYNIIGQLMALGYYLDPSQKEYIENGMNDFNAQMGLGYNNYNNQTNFNNNNNINNNNGFKR